jgi:hyperosmotically inducible protein
MPIARKFALALCFAFLTGCLGCSRADKENADAKAARAKEKTKEEGHRLAEDARKLGQEAKAEAKDLGRNIDHALNSTGPASAGAAETPDEKLRRGSAELREESAKAGVKLDRAALVAKVKAKLAADVGLSTVTSVDVDATGQVITLRGTVSSLDQKRQAEDAARQVSGVSRVIDNLRVQAQ